MIYRGELTVDRHLPRCQQRFLNDYGENDTTCDLVPLTVLHEGWQPNKNIRIREYQLAATKESPTGIRAVGTLGAHRHQKRKQRTPRTIIDS